MNEKWGYAVILTALVGVYFVGKLKDESTTEFIYHGDGVEYHDGAPMNQGGTLRRVSQELTPWEKQDRWISRLSVACGLLLLIGGYIIVRAANRN